jgi:uncharacterized membrane protein YfcA
MRPYLDRRMTWRGVGAAYGLMLLVFAVVWAVSYPTVAATVFALIVGTYVAIRISARIIHRRARRTVCVPGIDVCVTM